MNADHIIDKEISAYFRHKATNLLFVLSKEGKIIEANRYAHNLTGLDLAGKHFRDVIIDFTGQFDLAALLGDFSNENLMSVICTSGLPQSFYFTFKPISDYIIAFGRLDAEELENMRKEVLTLNHELNNLTRELHKKNAKLEQLNEEKNRFLGMAAHDLRKPIGLVITYSEFLIEEAESVLDVVQFGFLNTINASGTFMKRLVDDFLDVSAIEAGRFDLDLHPASIVNVLDKSLTLNRFQAEKKQIKLQVHYLEDMPTIQMDAAKIEQVITNLVSNALEHSNAGDTVVIHQILEPDTITVSIEDSGPGIPPEDMDKLFRPFEKTSTKKTAGEKSTGLGMLITRKIIEAHKGKIWVESQVGKGTTVSFQLPLHLEIQ